jgi:hypothetical protein
VLPLDYAAAAAEWRKTLQSLQRGAGRHLDLRPTLAEAARLVSASQGLMRARRQAAASGDRRAARAVNEGLMRLGRALIPIGHTRIGRFDHDPAMEQREAPLLVALRALGGAKGDDAKHLAVRAVRDLNAIRHALRQAADAAETAVQTARGTGRRAAGRRSRGR